MSVNCSGCIVFIVWALLLFANKPKIPGFYVPSSLPPADFHYNFYHKSCPKVEEIIKNTIDKLSANSSGIAPALIRLAFHDCFVEGCDASVLLDSVEGYIPSEKESIPNKNSLKGFHIIDAIKQRLEETCPETVSCADIIVLSARHAVVMRGGRFFDVKTGRRDSTSSFASLAESSLPSPFDDIQTMISTFKGKGFSEREMVSLLGAHTIGKAHCRFFEARLSNFNGTGHPDPTMDGLFRSRLSTLCNGNATSANRVAEMDTGGSASFDAHYYRNVKEGKGLLYVDQALMAADITRRTVELYASNQAQFYNDFAPAMIKLFNMSLLTGKQGQIRKDCSKVVSGTSRRSHDMAPFKDPQAPVP